MEVTNDLLNYNGLKIVQRNDGFAFSLDTVLLANFVTINTGVVNIIDLGCGNAPIPLILSTKTNAKILGVEIQKESVNLAKKSIEMNHLDEQISVIHADIKDICKELGTNVFDIVVSNPPYFKVHPQSKLNESKLKEIARHEICITLEEIVYNAKVLLKNNGYFAMVHRPERLVEIIEVMKANNIEPKRIKFVYSRVDSESNLLLIEGRKNGKPGLKVEPPLYVHDEEGNYLDVIQDLFSGGSSI